MHVLSSLYDILLSAMLVKNFARGLIEERCCDDFLKTECQKEQDFSNAQFQGAKLHSGIS